MCLCVFLVSVFFFLLFELCIIPSSVQFVLFTACVFLGFLGTIHDDLCPLIGFLYNGYPLHSI